MSINVLYGNISPTAKQEMKPEGDNWWGGVTKLQKDSNFKNYGDPYRYCYTALNGKQKVLPGNGMADDLALESYMPSNSTYNDGYEITGNLPITIKLISDNLHRSNAISLQFDDDNGIYPTLFNIYVYNDVNGNNLIYSKELKPQNEKVIIEFGEYLTYKRIDLEFYKINMPKNYLIFKGITYGIGVKFTPNNLERVSIIQAVNPISTEIEANIADFVFRTSNNLSIQKNQPFMIYKNGNLISQTYATSYKREAKDIYRVETQDYIGVAEKVIFLGGIYKDKSAGELYEEILKTANIPYFIDAEIYNLTVTGYIPYTNVREALHQVAFATQTIIDTIGGIVNIKSSPLSNDSSNSVDLNRIFRQNIETIDEISAVELTGYVLNKPINTDIKDLYTFEEASQTVELKFDTPIDISTLNFVDCTAELVLEHYIKVKSNNAGAKVTGAFYQIAKIVKTRKNENAVSTDTPEVISIENATLISPSNIDFVLDACYNYYVARHRIDMRYAERNGQPNDIIRVGEIVEIETKYEGFLKGFVEKQSYNVTNGVTSKNMIVGGAVKL